MKAVPSFLCATLLCLAVTACSTTPVGLTYNASKAPGLVQGKPSVVLTNVVDKRKHDANWLGAIRGGFGNPLKMLETPVPVRDVVKDAFVEGLKARNLLAGSAPYRMELEIQQFDCNQYARREAHAKIAVTLINHVGQPVFNKLYEADKVTGSVITFDAAIFASVEDLRQVADDVLQEVVNRALDDLQLRTVLN